MDPVKLAGCSLAKTAAKDNWVDEEGGLPSFICEVAKKIKEKGNPTGVAIAIAISQITKWIVSPNTHPKTKAKSVAAIAEWEKMKASAKAKRAKSALVKATASDGSGYVFLSAVSSFNTDIVRSAWDAKQKAGRKPGSDYCYDYIVELWTDYIIIRSGDSADGDDFQKVPYEVSVSGDVSFGPPVNVTRIYVEDNEPVVTGPSNIVDMDDVTVSATNRAALDKIVKLSAMPPAFKKYAMKNKADAEEAIPVSKMSDSALASAYKKALADSKSKFGFLQKEALKDVAEYKAELDKRAKAAKSTQAKSASK